MNKYCDNCGERIRGTYCGWCCEEAEIMERFPEYEYSEEFQEKAGEQRND